MNRRKTVAEELNQHFKSGEKIWFRMVLIAQSIHGDGDDDDAEAGKTAGIDSSCQLTSTDFGSAFINS